MNFSSSSFFFFFWDFGILVSMMGDDSRCLVLCEDFSFFFTLVLSSRRRVNLKFNLVAI